MEETYIDPEVKELRKALYIAWVLIGRCDMTLEELDDRERLSKQGRAAIQQRRAEIMRAMASSS